MCGLCGTTLEDKQFIDRAIKRMVHRGPDDQGWVKTEIGYLGHTRLSIIDVESSHQPMSEQNAHISFNGEVYNFDRLRKDVNHRFTTKGDTEVVMHYLLEYGIEAIHLLDGMFAFAFVSGEEIILGRDAIGIKPLYFIQTEEGIYFASEIKALIDVPGKIKEFPSGTTWSNKTGFFRYFHIDDLKYSNDLQIMQDEAALTINIQNKLRDAVQKRMIADAGVPVGVSLSGGLDSSIIAVLAKEGRDDLDTFVVGMPASEDVVRSREVALKLGTRHHERLYSFDEMIEVLPEVIYHLESYDGALIRSAIPNYFLAKLASDHVKVILTGEGADEIFGGYEYLSGIDDPDQFQNELWTITNNLHNTNLQRTDRMTMAHSIEGRVPFLDKEMIQFGLSIPPEYKFHEGKGTEKAILRKAFEGTLPDRVLYRPKQKFSHGAGSSKQMSVYANEKFSDDDFKTAFRQYPEAELRSKEELMYFEIFRSHFGDKLPLDLLGRTRSITRFEMN